MLCCQPSTQKQAMPEFLQNAEYQVTDSAKAMYNHYAKWFADSEMKRFPEAWQLDHGKRLFFGYAQGVGCCAMLEMWKATGDAKYYDYVAEWADTIVFEDGNIHLYDMSTYNIDYINSGKVLFDVYKQTGNEKYRKAETNEYDYEAMFHAVEAKVLVVDDNRMNLLVARKLLEMTGVQITEALSGTEALECMEREYYDLVLLDHMMPGIDGIETLKRARATEENKCKNAPMIALTANAFSGVREMYLAEGFDDYLSKPINGKQLEEMIIKYLPKEKVVLTERKKQSSNMVQEPEPEAEEEILDISKGLGYCANSEEVYKEILSMFCDLRTSSEEELAGYLAAEDWKNYTIKVHALKTNARSVGANPMGECCYELELAGKKIQAGEDVEEQKAFILEKHPNMLQMFDRTMQEVKKYMELG